jgi:Putative adhesin
MTASTSSEIVEHLIGPAGELSVRLYAGELELRAVDGDTVRIRDLDGRDLGERFTIDATEGRLAVRPRDRFLLDFGLIFGGSDHAVRLEVEAPSRARLIVDTASGEIHATGFVGEQRYRTASGEIRLDDVSGSVGVEAVSGDLDVHVNGEAAVTGRSVSGDVSVAGGRLRSVELSTTSGDVELQSELAGPGPFGVQTVSGDVSVASRGPLRVEAKTVTGDVSSDAPQRRETVHGQRIVIVGEGEARGTPFSFKSISGDLRVRRAGTGTTPTPPAEPAAHEADERATLRLAILRELEAGTIDVAAAAVRLSELEEAE